MISLFAFGLWQWAGIGNAQGKAFPQDKDAELTIVKYGSIIVKSPIPDAKVFIDGVYKGVAENAIENVIVGEHVIACRTENKSISGTFAVKKNETLQLEARFEEGRLVSAPAIVEKVEKEEKPEPVKPKKVEPVKHGKPKKTAPIVVAKREEPKDPQEERRKLHLTTMRIFFEIKPSQELRIDHKANQTVIGKYKESTMLTGRYYRTKQNVLLCDAGPCETGWTVSFLYSDEAGKNDAFLVSWKEIVFNGITPAGTSKRVLEWCLDGICNKVEDTSSTETEQVQDMGRYRLTWTKASVIIRRTDIMNEIAAAGKSLSDY